MIHMTRARTVLATGLCVFPGALLLSLGFKVLLPLPAPLVLPTLLWHLAGAGVMTLTVAITAWVALWPATPYLDLAQSDPEPRGAEPREAKAAALSFASRVATAGTCTGELTVVAGGLSMTVSGQALPLTLTMAATVSILVGLSWILIYALGQQAVAPLLSRLRDVSLPQAGRQSGVSLRGRLAYTLFIVVTAGLVSAAHFADAYLTRAEEQENRVHQAQTARWLKATLRGLDPRTAQRMCESLPLSQGYPSLQPPAPTAGNNDPTPETTATPPETTATPSPLVFSLPGGQNLYLPAGEAPERPVGILLVLLILLSCTGVIALQLSGLMDRDVGVLLQQVRELTQAQSGQVIWRTHAEAPELAESQQVSSALSRLMDRMRRLHVESYLAIERTIDGRRAKSQFLASMSHDLRSPLSSVLGFSELLTSGYEGDIPDAAQRRLLYMHRTGRRLLRLLSEILDTAKVESQTIELHPRLCSPGDLLSQAVAEARRGRMQDDMPVLLQIMPGLRPVHVDPVRFPQALAHLIGHVLDGAATTAGDGPDNTEAAAHKGHVRVSAREGRSPTDRTPTFEVEVEHIHPPGLSSDSTQPLGTVGLGLALPLARRLIALHGGTIEVGPGMGAGEPGPYGTTSRSGRRDPREASSPRDARTRPRPEHMHVGGTALRAIVPIRPH